MKILGLFFLVFVSFAFAVTAGNTALRTDILKKIYKLKKHSEGGMFSEVYTSPFNKDNRALAGSIYFLLEGNEISHFHQIDCDELWFYHEGYGLKITALTEDERHEYLLGRNVENSEKQMVLIKKRTVFAAENIDKNSFTFISCVTTPKFNYDGFRLIGKNEIREKYPNIADEIDYLAY